jgi:hypothetical protein
MRYAVLAALALGACSEPESAKLERQYDMMKSANRDVAELCSKAREVSEAYLAEENSPEYQRWNVNAAADCTEAAQR